MKELDIVKNDPYFSELIKKNNLDDKYIIEHINSFLRVLESRNKCLNCKGLYMCNQRSKGQRLSLDYKNVLLEEIEYCEYSLRELKKKKLLNDYVYCDVPENLSEIDLDNVSYTKDQEELYALLLGLLHDKSDKGLYICGDLGVGKTYLCTALANSLVKNKKKVAFVKVSNFFNQMKADVINNSELVDKTINALKSSDYLILDDIGSEAVSAFVRDDILFRILDYRLENKLITIFTSNLNKDELLKHYQYDRKEKSNLMNAKRLVERIDILTDDYVLSGKNMRRL